MALETIPIAAGTDRNGANYDKIVQLTDSNFENETKTSSGLMNKGLSWLLLFKAERYPHCQTTVPQFEALVTSNSNDDHPSSKSIDASSDNHHPEHKVAFATIDVPSNCNLAIRFGIKSIPALLFLHAPSQRIYTYKGTRDTKSMHDFLNGGFLSQSNVEVRDIPQDPSRYERIVLTLTMIRNELYNAAMGKSGMEGYAMIALLRITCTLFSFLIIGLVLLFTLPSKIDINNNNHDNKNKHSIERRKIKDN
eukprot:CAMPEP_0184861536 /NCGR_PEP_ID=MMETSP0580-20130426/6199_1 /TAXON_ID=1118495 /ORGANISM="Dactyliosolen fragilissimus" /LENGTH=250 /DNA_ID=CAMNT_0027359067 /DNA_START=131 /DNA_END=883 /DNA_ORIENTATION=+